MGDVDIEKVRQEIKAAAAKRATTELVDSPPHGLPSISEFLITVQALREEQATRDAIRLFEDHLRMVKAEASYLEWMLVCQAHGWSPCSFPNQE